MVSTATLEAARGERFEFGKNWQRFIKILNPERIAAAENSLRSMLDVEDLDGKTFLDIGSGSGLFSLAAYRLGAEVHSFDYDPQSAQCTKELKRAYAEAGDRSRNWTVEEASILDPDYLRALPKFDVVYSWGVLHHTGAMWQAIDNASQMVKAEGTFFIALYNDQGGISDRWKVLKRLYVRSPRALRPIMAAGCFVSEYWKRILKGTLRGRPFEALATDARGMSAWRDVVDWIGGYPFEVATPGDVFQFLRERGFTLTRMVTTSSLGCNEFVFRKSG